MIDRLTEHFDTALELPPDAIQWLLDLWRVTQMLDDVVDNDPINREELNSTIFWRWLACLLTRFSKHTA